MRIYNRIIEAITNLFAAKLRSILALLGILVGTASVVAMVSAGQLATAQALKQIKALGTDLLAFSLNYTGHESNLTSLKTKVSLSTIINMQKSIPSIKVIAPYINSYAPVSFAGHSMNAGIVATTTGFAKIVKFQLLQGRFVSLLDKHSFYCTIGNSIYEKLKKQTTNPFGKQIRIGKDIFTIIGITKKTDSNSFVYTDLNNSIFIPPKTAALLDKYARISNVVMKIAPNIPPNTVENQIKNYMKLKTTDQQLYFRSSAQVLESMKKQHTIFTIFLGFIGGLSLLVGGIGVMNIMLVAVNERKREIGIRRAVGATRKDIRLLFLTESIILALIGGILGVLAGILASFIIAEARQWGFHLFLNPPLLGFTVSLLTGVFFGIYPAHKAAKLRPVKALRTE